MCKKIYNNVAGFDYPVNSVALLQGYVTGSGGHHVQNRIKVLNGTFKLDVEQVDINRPRPPSESHVPLHPIWDLIDYIGAATTN
jgi:hypothetical protein